MFSHGYIKNDFDVDEWARPEFLEKAADEVLKEEWERRSWSKLPHGRRARGGGHAARVARRSRPGVGSDPALHAPGHSAAHPAWSRRAHGQIRETAMAKTALQMVMEASARIEHVSPARRRPSWPPGTAVLLDIREPTEWEDHIAGAVQVPRGLLEFAADPTSPRHLAELDPARRVIVYCRSGARAALAGATLKELGFEDVANLDGGITAWKEAGLPIAEHHDGL